MFISCTEKVCVCKCETDNKKISNSNEYKDVDEFNYKTIKELEDQDKKSSSKIEKIKKTDKSSIEKEFKKIDLNNIKENTSNKFLMGEYPLKGDIDHAVVDGDTIKVEGLKDSIRILFIDTEESFKHETAEAKTEQLVDDWDNYISKQENSVTDKPIKFNTPIGYEATLWARDFFKDSEMVRLEYDSLTNKKGYYNRHLAYVYGKKNDKWVNFNIEIVKAGYTPYSTKYGRSIRFHDQFVAAQKYAKKHKLGVWDPNKMHYTDYDVRLKWWNKRGDQIHEYRTKHNKTHLFIGGKFQDYWRLKNYIGKNVKIFALLKGAEGFGDEITFKLPVRRFLDVYVHLSKKAGYSLEELKKHKDYYIYLNGKIIKENYTNDKGWKQFRFHLHINKKSGLRFAK